MGLDVHIKYITMMTLSVNCLSVVVLGMPSKKTVKFGTLAQKVGGSQASIPNFRHILIGTKNVGGRGLKGSCHKIIQSIFAHHAQVLWTLE